MTQSVSNPEIERSVEQVIDSLDGLYDLPTHNFAEFTEAFYEAPSRSNVANNIYGIIDSLGEPLKPRNKKEAILWSDRQQTQLARRLGGYSFKAIATIWGADDEDRFRAVDLIASTRVVPLLTRKRTLWTLKMRAGSVDAQGELVGPMGESDGYFDEASVASYAFGKKPTGLKSNPHPMQNIAVIPEHRRPWESVEMWTPSETPFDRAVRMTQPKAMRPEMPRAERTADNVPILQSAEVNRRIQLFRDNFFDLNVLLLAATGMPIAIEFIREQQAETPAGLSLVPPLSDEV